MKRLLAIALLWVAGVCRAQPVYQYYYLSVGSGNYEHRPEKFAEPGFLPFDELPEAILSARLMQGLLEKGAKAKGELVLSAEHSFITKQRLLAGLNRLDQRIRADHAVHPFIVFYYCGHGISENMGWNQFFIPGNYTRTPGNKSFEELNNSLIFLGDITDFFLKKKYEYMVLVDCCRKEGKDSSLPEKRLSYFFSQQNVETFKTVVAALKYLNEYHQANPVVFAISPGSVVPTVAVPEQSFIPDSKAIADEVGPLCRRSLLVYQRFSRGAKKEMTVHDFVAMATGKSLDGGSPAPVSFYEDQAPHASGLVIFRK